MPAPPRDLIFISYSHEDKTWLDKLVKVLAPLVRNGHVKYWTDAQMEPGDRWRRGIASALKTVTILHPISLRHQVPASRKRKPAG